jgi:hypothetical protein
MRQQLFSFSRLFQEAVSLQTFIRHARLPSEKPMPQVARNIAHRLRIVTSLASVVTEHRRQILAGLQFFNDAYAVTASKNRAGGLGAVWRAGVLRHGGDLRPRGRRLPRPL